MVYLDYASTTPVRPEVLEVYELLNRQCWANPSNKYNISAWGQRIFLEALERVAKCIGAETEEIYFTSGASEGNSWACVQREKVYCSPFEHHNYNRPGVEVVEDGCWSEDMRGGVYAHMLVSNITGEIFDVKRMFEKAKKLDMFCVCDCTQALGNVDINVRDLGCDMAVFSSHKVGGLKGTGFVWIKQGIEVKPLIYGTQQDGLRGGTMNVGEYASTVEAVEGAVRELKEKKRVGEELTRVCVEMLGAEDWLPISGARSVGSTFAFCLRGIESEIVQHELNKKGIYVAVSSGCNDGSMKREPTLKAIGVPEEYIGGFFRLSFGLKTKREEVETAMKELLECYRGLKNGK